MANLYESDRKLNNDNNVSLGNGSVVQINKTAEQDKLTASISAAADISLSAIDELRDLIGDKRATKLLQAVKDPNVTTEELKYNIAIMKQGLPKEDQARFSHLLSAIAIATGSEKLLTANFLSDIERQPKNNPSSKFLEVLKEHPLSSYEADFQKRMSTLDKYYRDLQNKQPAESKVLKGIAEAVLAISIALREYNKAKEEKQAKEEELNKKTKEETAKKEQEDREKKQIERALRYVYPANADTAKVRDVIEMIAKNDTEKRGDGYYMFKAQELMRKETIEQEARARHSETERKRKVREEEEKGASILSA